jgi:hypothetical protein
MSIDYSASIVVGYRLTLEDALEPFEVKVGEDEFTEEDRFDPKTGKKVGTEKVRTASSYVKHVWKKISTTVDEEEPEAGWPEDHEEVGDLDFLEKVAEANGFQCLNFGESSSDDWEVVFFPKNHPDDLTEGKDWGRLQVEGHLDWGQVCEMGKDLVELRKKLVKLGLKPGKPEIVLAASAS